MIRLSIVLTNFNDAPFLQKRVESILVQLGPNDELVITDDCSTDSSPELLDFLAQKDERICYQRNEINLGPIATFTLSAQRARGAYLVMFASDDEVLPGFIEENMRVLEAHTDLAVCCSDNAKSFADEPSNMRVDRLVEQCVEPLILRPPETVSYFRQKPFWIPSHTAVFRRDLFLRHGGVLESLGPYCDWYALHALALKYGLAYIPKALAVWRQDPKSYSKAVEKKRRRAFELALLDQQGEMQKLLFRSGLLNYYVKKHFWRLLFQCKHLPHLANYCTQVISNRMRRANG